MKAAMDESKLDLIFLSVSLALPVHCVDRFLREERENAGVQAGERGGGNQGACSDREWREETSGI